MLNRLRKAIANIILFLVSFYLTACGNDSTTGVQTVQHDVYKKAVTAQSGSTAFEIWTVGKDTLMSGYNKVGFKVFSSGAEMRSGFVKFYARMYHLDASSYHSTPVEPVYYFNQSLEMYTGYIIMLMPSDSVSPWYGFYSYNDSLNVDSLRFDVGWNQKARFKIFDDIEAQMGYLITMVTPEDPVKGFNDFTCLLHQSPDFLSFTQVNTAQMYIAPKLDSLNHVSNGNTNPVYTSEGLYKGRVNFDYSGAWMVYDSINYNNRWITKDGTPIIYYSVP